MVKKEVIEETTRTFEISRSFIRSIVCVCVCDRGRESVCDL
jgi:hypothetical protein